MKKNLTVYAQRWQPNGYFPVECFKRVNDVWFTGLEKTNGFKMRESKMDDKYYYFDLSHNYIVFSTTEIHSGYSMNKGNITIEEIKELIFDN